MDPTAPPPSPEDSANFSATRAAFLRRRDAGQCVWPGYAEDLVIDYRCPHNRPPGRESGSGRHSEHCKQLVDGVVHDSRTADAERKRLRKLQEAQRPAAEPEDTAPAAQRVTGTRRQVAGLLDEVIAGQGRIAVEQQAINARIDQLHTALPTLSSADAAQAQIAAQALLHEERAAELAGKAAESERERLELERELGGVRVELEQAEELAEQLAADTEAAEQHAIDLQAKLTAAQEKAEQDAKAAVTRLEQAQQDADKRVRAAQTQATAEIEAAQAKAKAAETERNAAVAAQLGLEKNLTEVRKQLAEAEQRAAAATETAREKLTALTVAISERDHLDEQLTAANTSLKESRTEAKGLVGDVARLQAQAVGTKTDAERERAAREAAEERLREQAAAHAAQLAALTTPPQDRTEGSADGDAPDGGA